MFNKNISPDQFLNLADQILNKTILKANNTQFRICEIEMYLRNDSHPDEYVHKNIDQLAWEKFYFHKFSNGTFKAGTFKGLDICLGDTETNTYFGILIRSIQNINTGEFTEGSCNCVNKILEQFNVSNVKELFQNFFPNTNQIDISNELLGLVELGELGEIDTSLEPTNHYVTNDKIFMSPRIGLSDKYPEYKTKLYRYAIKINNIKKQKKSFVDV
jgi:hypothetical protein